MNDEAIWSYDGCHQLGEGQYATITVEDVIERFYDATGSGNDAELGAYLGVSVESIFDLRRSNKVPVDWFRTMLKKKPEISPIWLLTGKEDPFWNEPFAFS